MLRAMLTLLLMQGYLLFGDQAYLDMFTELYTSAMYGLTLRLHPGSPADSPSPPPWLADADMQTGKLAQPWISSLSAFWPGLQALAGQSASYPNLAMQFYRISHDYWWSAGKCRVCCANDTALSCNAMYVLVTLALCSMDIQTALRRVAWLQQIHQSFENVVLHFSIQPTTTCLLWSCDCTHL